MCFIREMCDLRLSMRTTANIFGVQCCWLREEFSSKSKWRYSVLCLAVENRNNLILLSLLQSNFEGLVLTTLSTKEVSFLVLQICVINMYYSLNLLLRHSIKSRTPTYFTPCQCSHRLNPQGLRATSCFQTTGLHWLNIGKAGRELSLLVS